MKWIKSAEQRPDEFGDYVARYKPDRRGIVKVKYTEWQPNSKSHYEFWIEEVEEWLDETPELPLNTGEQEREERLMDIVNAQGKYIAFLSKEIARTAVYLNAHRMGCTAEVAAEGIELRGKITELMQTP